MKKIHLLTFIIAICSLLFNSCEDKDDDVVTDNCPELAFESFRENDYTYVFKADFRAKDSIVYGWYINGELIEREGNNITDTAHKLFWQFDEGTYEICIKTETPDCPRGTSFCKEIEITDRPCAELSFSRDGEYLYADYKGAPDDALYTWFVNGEEVDPSPNSTDRSRKFPINKLRVGTSGVCVVAKIDGCDELVEYCQRVVIEDQPDTTCPTMTIDIDGDLYADFKGATSNTLFKWFIDNIEVDQFPNTSNESRRFPVDKIQAGTYKVCVTAIATTCDREIEFCKEITIE